MRLVVAGLAALMLLGCEQTSRIQPVYEQAAIRVNNPDAARPVQFSRIVIDLKRGEQIGTFREGVNYCAQPGTLVYRGGRMSLDDSELTQTFRDELARANYRVVGDPDALFEDPSSWGAEFLVAGRVTRIDADLCYAYMTWEQVEKVSGAALLEVEWQVYSRLDRKVVHQTHTRGRGEVDDPSTSGQTDILLDAFAQATRNLLADRRFHDLVAGNATAGSQGLPATAQVLPADIPMPQTKAFSGSIARNAARLRQGVVTILVAGGHGSGFFIDEAGRLLTNAHVVGGAERVKIVLAGGLEATGTVLARDPRRDVALVQVELGKTAALPLRPKKPEVGAEVYAMGSPLDPSLDATLSKGIVSAHRSMDGLDFIQSDVNVLGGSSGGPLLDTSGNVIGMTVAGAMAGDVSMGLNYFIPIGDAVATVGIGDARRTAVKSGAAKQAPNTSETAVAESIGLTANISISPLRLFSTSLTQNLSSIRSNLAAVSNGTTWGSGFFLDQQGHLLTNAHIVRSAKQVQIRMNSGDQFVGRVVSVEPRRNLALVEVVDAVAPGLPLQIVKPQLGSMVYAIGSPTDDGASITGNRGIVIYRVKDDIEIIRSQMKMQPASAGTPLLDEHGNVLGIAVADLLPNEPGAISFFIPIAQALRALGVSLTS